MLSFLRKYVSRVAIHTTNFLIQIFLRILIHFFRLFFAVPPSIRPDPPDGNYVVKKGRKVELRCLASGNPDPTITWSRQVRNYRISFKSLLNFFGKLPVVPRSPTLISRRKVQTAIKKKGRREGFASLGILQRQDRRRGGGSERAMLFALPFLVLLRDSTNLSILLCEIRYTYWKR